VSQIFVEAALMGRPLRIEGDGADRLDFTYIDDLVEGVCLTIARPAARNQVFNLTYGSARSIRELAEVVTRHFPGACVEAAARDALMPERGTLSVARASHLLGYQPRFPIEEGMARYIEWYRAFGLASRSIPRQP
jgi:nucleoside-diphosphate-sugar epimerase